MPRKAADTEPRKVFSVRVPEQLAAEFRAYCQALGKDATIDKTAAAALGEYMKRHKLTGEQKDLYDLLIKRLGE